MREAYSSLPIEDIAALPLEDQVQHYQEEAAYQRGRAAGEAAASLLMTSTVTEQLIEVKEEARYDKKTGVYTEDALKNIIAHDQRQNLGASRGLLFIDIGNFKKANKYTTNDGDMILQKIGALFNRDGESFGRAGDRADEFIGYINLENRSSKHRSERQILRSSIRRIQALRKQLVSDHPFLDEGTIRLFLGTGGVIYNPELTYDQNKQLANIEMGAQKDKDREKYGAYRVDDGNEIDAA